MQHPADVTSQRVVDEAMLAHPAESAEGRRDNAGAIVIAVAGEILDRDFRVREGSTQAGLELGL